MFGWFRKRASVPGAPVIVVSGLPRSGTSMAMRMLEAGGVGTITDGERTADEDNPRGYFEDERVKRLAKDPDKRWVAESRGKALKVISFLLPELPPTNRYKVIFVEREIREVLASQAKMLERRGKTSNVDDDAMAEHYRSHLTKVRRFVDAAAHFEILDLRHAEVLADPSAAAEKVRAFLDLDLDVAAMAAAVDPTLHRNRAGA